MQKTPEIQQQIANDARLARMISNRIHSPTKKGQRRKYNSRNRTSITVTPRRLAFGDEEKEGQAQDGASITPRRLAI